MSGYHTSINIMRTVTFIFSLLVVSLPKLASAQFVICNGTDCSACDLVSLVNQIIVWLVGILMFVFAILAVKAGFELVMSQGAGDLKNAKESFVNAFIGLLIILSAWLIVDTMIRGLGVTQNGRPFPWSEVQCQLQTAPLEGTVDSWSQRGAGWSTSTLGAIGSGTPAIASFAQAMQSQNCIYDQARRNGCQGNPGYTDCSDLVNVAFRAAGCRSPGVTTAQQIQAAGRVGDRSTLRPGDALIYRAGGQGHVVICQDAGCSRVIHAAGTGRGIVTDNSNYFLGRSDIQAIRASDFCN